MKKVTLRGELLHPSDFVAAVELKGRDVTVTITKVEKESLKMKGGISEVKPVLSFKESPRKLVLNRTNADSIAHLYGTEAEDWVGKRIIIYPTTTQCGRENVDCIRVRERIPAEPKPKTEEVSQ